MAQAESAEQERKRGQSATPKRYPAGSSELMEQFNHATESMTV